MPRQRAAPEKAGKGSKRSLEASSTAASKVRPKKPKTSSSASQPVGEVTLHQPRTIIQVNADHQTLRVASPIPELPPSRSTTERMKLLENPCPQVVRPLGHPKKGEKDMNDSTVCRFAYCKKEHSNIEHARACEKQHFDLRWSLVQSQSETPEREAASLECLIEGCTKMVVVNMDAEGTSANKQMMRHYEAVHAHKRFFCEGGCGFVCSTLAQLNVHTKAMNERTQKELGATASGTTPVEKKPKPSLGGRERTKKVTAPVQPAPETDASALLPWFEVDTKEELPPLFGTIDFNTDEIDCFPVPLEEDSLLILDEDFSVRLPPVHLIDFDAFFGFNEEGQLCEETPGW